MNGSHLIQISSRIVARRLTAAGAQVTNLKWRISKSGSYIMPFFARISLLAVFVFSIVLFKEISAVIVFSSKMCTVV